MELFLVRIQSKYGKIRTRNNPVFGHFSRSARYLKIRLGTGRCKLLLLRILSRKLAGLNDQHITDDLSAWQLNINLVSSLKFYVGSMYEKEKSEITLYSRKRIMQLIHVNYWNRFIEYQRQELYLLQNTYILPPHCWWKVFCTKYFLQVGLKFLKTTCEGVYFQ